LEVDKMLDRYRRNVETLTVEENDRLKDFRVCVVGCGGLGGYVIEMLGRLGIGRITAVDGDSFDESNLNRQILSDSKSMGVNKALKAKQRMEIVNPLVNVQAIGIKLSNENGLDIIRDSNVVIDALDSIETRLILEKLCDEVNVPLVHGAIAGWYGQVSTIFPGDKTLSRFYKSRVLEGIEKKLGNPSFTPALVASIQVSEVIKILIGRGELLRRKLLIVDMLNQDYEVVSV
jgi:molybdopterin/thiamine biosynthesis adenylyltransferase